MAKQIVALLQARTDSTRLPGKVLKKLLDTPMIIHELHRISKSKYITELILATSDEASDDDLSQVIIHHGFNIYRGSKNNVLKRFIDALKKLNLNDDDIVVRLTGDCPVHDSKIIDETISAFLETDCDYLTNSVKPIYPDGLDVEVFTYASLKMANKLTKKPSQVEHATPFIRDSGLFKTVNLLKKEVYPQWRLTVDEPEDFIVIEKIYNHFGNNNFSLTDIISYLEKNPDIININSHINRNEGYLKSVEEDLRQKDT
ncbi:cytidylyltransferase domain-containing protein [Sulfurimonas autotrophica]|uniref:Acylneuraminate cytidylyltransferase n=1 Tax=Sulfurimonas autotrophica (strain ATCC BAA-671 / DSM 16294 / JCM 11897 / OK10) TaxID=563040 RepID=E0UT80_SULAO|nr:glycosyltransferase family protein [Sulfurimonas autotrophica]ADN08183.1 acylneuraminate cytidylyltransferase [Sulfurimonas autotrophica DSM 16294]